MRYRYEVYTEDGRHYIFYSEKDSPYDVISPGDAYARTVVS